MSASSSDGYANWVPAWAGFAVGLCTVLPTLLKLERGGWTEADIWSLAAGTVLVISCVTRLVIILPQTIRQDAKAETEGHETP